MLRNLKLYAISLAIVCGAMLTGADDGTVSTQVTLDTLWVLITAMLVFFMNLGFATVESGFARAKNCVNILSKNFVVFAVSSLGFLVLGWGLMFGDGSPFIGLQGLFFLNGADNSPAVGDAYKGVYSSISWTGVPLLAKFFFQLVFCGTAATIVSGAVAERVKYVSFIVFSFAMAIFIYPVIGHWVWGGGWLSKLGMYDFAGSTVVHSVGGWAALIGALVLGPRIGKYGPDGRPRAIPGHNISMATLGAFVLWLGWFGFNPGSTMAANPSAIAHVVITTNMAAAMGLLSSTVTSWLLLGKPDLGMTINGCLAGLVAITAPCAYVSLTSALAIGAIGGILVVLAVLMFDRLRIDDPVGALSVHLVNGIFGTLCVGIFAEPAIAKAIGGVELTGLLHGSATQFFVQLAGVAGTAVFVVLASLVVWLLIKVTMGVRVSQQEELRGLDIGEHGMEAYSGFQIFITQ
jgi:Amt family ammonium transporter